MNPAHRRYRLLMSALALFLLMAPSRAPSTVDVGTATGVGDAATAPLRWPLDLPAHWLTSNFMEYRGGRFHAGIDLKTRETEGFPAYAVEDGWISRVRATPAGQASWSRIPAPQPHRGPRSC